MAKTPKRSAVVLGAVGFSLLASLAAPAVASADPWQPFSGPAHPVRHYLGDVEHPIWAVTHPYRALLP